MVTTALSILVVSVFLYYGVPLAYTLSLRRRLRSKAARGRQLVLTFDDGPGRRLTPRILDLLHRRGCKATFFLLGRNVAGREDLAQRIASEGHEISTHGFEHRSYWKAGPLRTVRDIKRGWRAVDQALGRQGGVYPFRPPHGKLNLAGLLYLWLRRAPIVYWTFDVGDTWAPEARDRRLAGTLTLPPGGAVVLAHDFDRSHAEVDDLVLSSVETLVAQSQQAGMPIVTVSDFLKGTRS
jgi:peptidoglycan/xylan/chitin deacetylase (PgdA/CDA1 family)